MKSDQERKSINETTGEVLASAFRVSNVLGHGFLEKVYENALAVELRDAGRSVVQQCHFEVLYKRHVVGEYCPDAIVDGLVVLEIKALDHLSDCHFSQCLNYLRVTGLSTALLLNFGRPRVEYRRVVREL